MPYVDHRDGNRITGMLRPGHPNGKRATAAIDGSVQIIAWKTVGKAN